MKKVGLFIICIIFGLVLLRGQFVVFAFDGETGNRYVVYTENNQYLFEKSSVEVGDSYISKDFKLYTIVEVDTQRKVATAQFEKELKKPNISVNPHRQKIESGKDRKICLYLTHNDESYVPSDGYDSVYGAGGVHDVAKRIQDRFEKVGVQVWLDETLHIPHDTTAYNRSGVTANHLLKSYEPDAIFDIHRDGVGRSYYVTNVDGKERCKIRIVVGKANPNYEENLEFAMYLLSVAESDYPWLFSDIYMAKGHYNQGLYNKSLLFEMGTYLIEKELVLDSVEPLVDVVTTALYSTTVDTDSGEILVGGEETPETPTINEHFNNIEIKKNNDIVVSIIIIVITFIVVGGGVWGTIYILNQNNSNKKGK
ncbi:MAG: stage II sporulation protein P [Clostridia bacterium]|nr:stage II sporulation protein P [Clostridia bacterium]